MAISSLLVCGVVLHISLTWLAMIRTGLAASKRHSAEPLHIPSSAIDWPSVTVLVPAWNEQGTIQRCITSLQSVDYPDWNVIIAAGGPDGTLEAVRNALQQFRNFQVIEQPPYGKNAALNLALKQATGAVIVILDADSRVEPMWLYGLVSPLLSGAHTSTGNFFAERQTPVTRCSEMEKISAYQVHSSHTLQGSGSIALHREVIERLKGFPEDVVVGVDWDLNVRVEKTGFRRAFAQEAHVYTQRPATLGEFWKNEVRWRRAHFRLLWLHRDWFFKSIPRALGSVLFYLVTLALTACIAITVLIESTGLVAHAGQAWVFTMLFITWVLGRRAALAAEIASFTKEAHWLGLSAMLGLLLLLSMLASWRAVLTLNKHSPHFKGPRIHLKRDAATNAG